MYHHLSDFFMDWYLILDTDKRNIGTWESSNVTKYIVENVYSAISHVNVTEITDLRAVGVPL